MISLDGRIILLGGNIILSCWLLLLLLPRIILFKLTARLIVLNLMLVIVLLLIVTTSLIVIIWLSCRKLLNIGWFKQIIAHFTYSYAASMMSGRPFLLLIFYDCWVLNWWILLVLLWVILLMMHLLLLGWLGRVSLLLLLVIVNLLGGFILLIHVWVLVLKLDQAAIGILITMLLLLNFIKLLFFATSAFATVMGLSWRRIWRHKYLYRRCANCLGVSYSLIVKLILLNLISDFRSHALEVSR